MPEALKKPVSYLVLVIIIVAILAAVGKVDAGAFGDNLGRFFSALGTILSHALGLS